jgi:hypothetical protein
MPIMDMFRQVYRVHGGKNLNRPLGNDSNGSFQTCTIVNEYSQDGVAEWRISVWQIVL